MHGIIGSIGLLILAAGIAAGGVSLVTSYWRVNGDEHKGFWMECLSDLIDTKIKCISNIEGDVDKAKYSDNDWYIAIVCCHAFGVVAGFIGLMVTLLTVCLSDDTSTKTFFAVILGIISCCCYIASVTMWKTQFLTDDGFKDGWSFFLGIASAGTTGIAAGVITVGAYVE